MRVIYHCYGGSHASPVAAAIHLHKLPATGFPGKKEIQSLALFDTVPPSFHGTMVFVGKDRDQNEVFVLGARNSADILLKTIKGITRIIGEDPHDYMFTDVKPCINLEMRIGGFLSRSLGLVSIGRPIVTRGVARAYPKIADLVLATRERLRQSSNGGGS